MGVRGLVVRARWWRKVKGAVVDQWSGDVVIVLAKVVGWWLR